MTKPLSGKTVSILGASISTFAGYIPADHRPRYPDTHPKCDVTDVRQTYWMQLIEEQGARLGVNDSWAGSCVCNIWDEDTGDVGPTRAMASMTRIKNLGTNGTPDLILFFGGGNDYVRGCPLGEFHPETAPTEAEFFAVKWDTVADAYTAAILRMKAVYPNARIIAQLPFSHGKPVLEAHIARLAAICRHYGIVSLAHPDIVESEMLYDGNHPNAYAMGLLADELRAVL